MKTLKVIPAQTEQKPKRKRISAKDAIQSAKAEQKNYEKRGKFANDQLISKVKNHYKNYDLNPNKYVYKFLNGTVLRTAEETRFIRESKKRHGLRTQYGLKHIQKFVPVWDDAGNVIDAIETIVSVATRERYTNIKETLTLRKWGKRTKRKKSGNDLNDQRLKRIIESDNIVDRDHYTTVKVMKLDSETWSEYKKRKREFFDLKYKAAKVLSVDHVNKVVHQDKPERIKHPTINHRDNNWATVMRHLNVSSHSSHSSAEQYEFDQEGEYVDTIHRLRIRKSLEILRWLFCD